jgi:hypothetical protein
MRLQGKTVPITGGCSGSGLQRRVGSPPREPFISADYSFSKCRGGSRRLFIPGMCEDKPWA